jgi:WD40 repeat protein
MHTLRIDTGRFEALAFGPGGRFLAALDSWRQLHLWDLGMYARWLSAPVPGLPATGRLAFSADGGHLILGDRLWDAGPLLDLWDGASAPLGVREVFPPQPLLDAYCLAFAPGGQALARCTRVAPGTGHLADLEVCDLGGKRLVLCDSPGYVNRDLPHPLAFAPDGGKLAGTQVNYSIRLWDVGTGEEVAWIEHTERVNAVAWSPRGRLLATAAECVVRLWNPVNQNCLATFQPFRQEVRVLAFHPRGRFLAAGSNDGTIRLWEMRRGREVAARDWQVGAVRALAFAPDGRTAAAAGDGDTAVIWDLDER